ncbi:MAG: DUF418 domain-containing protein [Phycisphaerae bacterium]|nr:DUF418 domain-containing protein [Phycisphaerae bacterium]
MTHCDPSQTPALCPTARQERYRYLDVLRGIALLGILPANIPFFAIPMTSHEAYWATESGWREPLAFYMTRFFVEYKFITIFSLLFGVGLALIGQRCLQSGRSFRRLYFRRILALAVFGFLHVLLLWCGDILLYYACGGFIAMWMVNWSPKTLRRVGIALLLVPAVFMLLVSGMLAVTQDIPEVSDMLQVIEQRTRPQSPPPEGFEGMAFVERLKYFGPELEQVVYNRGSFLEIMAIRSVTWIGGLVMFGICFGWRILGLFLLGMALLKSGWFTQPGEHMGKFRKLGIAGFAIGVPIQLLGLVFDAGKVGGYAGDWAAECCQYVGSLGVSAGYIALIAWFFVKLSNTAWHDRFAAVGRSAFSNYILQSILCTSLFYAYGLGLFGMFDRMQLWTVVLAVWMIMLVVSRPWLTRFNYGPLEWAWRRLTYGQPIAMRTKPIK